MKTNDEARSEGKPEGKPDRKPGKKPYYRPRKRYYKPRHQTESETTRLSFKKVSVVVPLYNEFESLKPLYLAIKKSINDISCDFEILFIDDGSTDKSLVVLKELGREDKRVKYISFKKNYGKAAALQVGFNKASGDAVITMDADLQDDPAEIINLLKQLDKGFDLVSGWKKKRFDPIIKRVSSKFFNWINRIFTGVKLHDMNCGLKAYRKDVVKSVRLYGELHRFVPVLADWQGFTVSEIVVKHHPRRYGKTKYGISRFFKGFVDLITVLFTTRYIKRPMHLFGFLGAFAFFIGFLVNAYLTYEWFMGKSLSNRPLLLLGALMIVVGVQFFAVGLLGEILVHNSADEKEYTIKDKN